MRENIVRFLAAFLQVFGSIGLLCAAISGVAYLGTRHPLVALTLVLVGISLLGAAILEFD